MKRIGVPRELNGNPLEIETVTKATVGLELIRDWAAKTSSIASTIIQTKMRMEMKDHPGQKY